MNPIGETLLKSWETDEWKEKKAKYLEGKCCERCGSKEALNFAHKDPVLSYRVQYKKASQLLLEVVVRKGIYKSINKYACPICFSFKIEKLPTSKYRCLRCLCSFTKPYIYDNLVRINEIDALEFEQKYAHLIKKFVDKERQMQSDDCKAFRNVKILCKTCHKASRKRANADTAF